MILSTKTLEVFAVISFITCSSLFLYHTINLDLYLNGNQQESNALRLHKQQEHKIHSGSRSMMQFSFVATAVNTVLSKILKFVFESPFSGANTKTLSCFAAYGLAGVDFSKPDRFSDWFDDDSLMELYAAGKYEGLDGIKEYVEFVTSKDFKVYEALSDLVTFSEVTDESDACNITYVAKRRISMADYLFPDGVCYETSVGATARFTITGDETFIYVDLVNIFFPQAYFKSLSEDFLDGAIAERVCNIMEEKCVDTWDQNGFEDQSECKASVDALPFTEAGYFNGHSQSCRWLHSVFAEENENHCAHISTIPLEDPNGKIKCQESQFTRPDTLFSSAELSFFEETSMKRFGFDQSMVKACDI